jgi:serine/threonine-protein kinase
MSMTTEIRPGVVLAGRYHVRGRLGAGGMATVFLAEDDVLRRDVAIKRLHTEGSDANVKRFGREARIGASLLHPNFVTIFDTISSDDGVLIIMEHVAGRPLSDLIGEEGMDPEQLLRILGDLASALDYAHENGVVHRDIKPANVLIAADGRVKLVDFGTATASDLTQITAENEIVGTLAYIAPERLAGESVGEPASDIYALAVLAFEALSGQKPRRAATAGELLGQTLHGPTPDIAAAWADAPPELASVLAQGMDPDPGRRQASAGALIRDIDAAMAAPEPEPTTKTEPIPAPLTERLAPAVPPPPPRRPPVSRSSGRPRWLVPALLAGCVLAVVAVVLASDGDGGGSLNQPPWVTKKAQAGASKSEHSKPPASSNSPSSTATPAPASADGAQLNQEGYSLIQQGRYAEAIPILRRAVDSFPAGTSDLNYAYALFNLGHALRLNGQPEEAIPILEQRLQIPNQTATVQAELDAARAAVGGAEPKPPKPEKAPKPEPKPKGE